MLTRISKKLCNIILQWAQELDGTYQALKPIALLLERAFKSQYCMVIWFINSNEWLESILFMVTLKGSLNIIKQFDILHGCYATVCMLGYKPNHGL